MATNQKLAEHKLIILYFIHKVNAPVSNSRISQLALERNFMNYFQVQEYLQELADSGLLEQSFDHQVTRYVLTEEGTQILDYFKNTIPAWIIHDINTHIHEHIKETKAEFSVVANYFPCENDEYLVKCGVYEDDGSMLMEINTTVATRKQAKAICRNWKKNVNSLYGSIILEISGEQKLATDPAHLPKDSLQDYDAPSTQSNL